MSLSSETHCQTLPGINLEYLRLVLSFEHQNNLSIYLNPASGGCSCIYCGTTERRICGSRKSSTRAQGKSSKSHHDYTFMLFFLQASSLTVTPLVPGLSNITLGTIRCYMRHSVSVLSDY